MSNVDEQVQAARGESNLSWRDRFVDFLLNKERGVDPNEAQAAREAAAKRLRGRMQPKDFGPSIKAGAESGMSGVADFLQSIPRGVQTGLSQSLSATGQAAAAEMSEPDMGIPTGQDVFGELEKITGQLHKPAGAAGAIGAGIGEALGTPATYVMPGMVGALAKGAPAAVKGALTGAATTLVPGSEEAGAEEPTPDVPPGQRASSGEWWRTKREDLSEYIKKRLPPMEPPTLSEQESKMYADPEWTPPKGWSGDRDMRQVNEGPIAHSKRVAALRDEQSKRETARLAALKDKQNTATFERAKEQERLEKEYTKEQERLDKLDAEYKDANESFRRAHPQLSTALPFIGAAAAGMIPYIGRMRALKFNNELVKNFENAVTKAENTATAGAVEQKTAIKELKAQMGPKGLAREKETDPGLFSKPAAGAMVTGVGGAVEGGLVPYELDLNLPSDSPDRREAADPSKWADRALYSVIPGALGGALGAELPLLRRGKAADIPRAEGLVEGLKPPRAPRKPKTTKEEDAGETLKKIQKAAQGNRRKLKAVKKDED